MAPTHARVLDALLPADLNRPYDPDQISGKDNFACDRDMTALLHRRAPGFRASVHAGHMFLLRAVAELARAGVSQFAVIGCGFPRKRNVHTVAREINPAAHVLYLDHDTLVAAYGRALLEPESRFAQADPGDPAAILAAIGHPHGPTGWLDPREPIALVFGSLVLEQLDAPGQVIAELVAALASGYVTVTHICTDTDTDVARRAATVYTAHNLTLRPRTTRDVTTMLTGMELLGPGLTVAQDWTPGHTASPGTSEASWRCCWAALGTWGATR
ncbi:SAM-dependent methyltransferase [Nocardia gipuzkoensis]|uniref:SAM-dependent methyltransferase n=1 Tax=Nocardia gipuzkoensis TaxID=2749991 RepID=UPI00237E1622|nr:SAM-dependent methyltransferase [Nocardia gipuzkoensis]MDE1674784.1 SAM-dependent methyltransferase [Nocardia gipuzkoensis]